MTTLTFPLAPLRKSRPTPAHLWRDMRVNAQVRAQEPALASVEPYLADSVPLRRFVMRWLPRGGVGAEIGVFTGLFGRELLRWTESQKVFFVDPWEKVYGERYPDWGRYTANGALTTRGACEAARLRFEAEGRPFELVKERGDLWLESLPDHSLDWVYLDASHTYEDTIAELERLDRKLKRQAILIGDDYFPNPAETHHGVYRAVNAFVKKTDWEVMFAGVNKQWGLRRLG